MLALMRKMRSVYFGMILLLALLVACEATPPAKEPVPAVGSVITAPSAATIEVGSSLNLEATVTDTAGEPLLKAVNWSSSQPGVATVTSNGLVTGLSAGGPLSITAELDGVRGTSLVTVLPAPTSPDPEPGPDPEEEPGDDDEPGSDTDAEPIEDPEPDPQPDPDPDPDQDGEPDDKDPDPDHAGVASITVEPATLELEAFATSTLRAIIRDADGEAVDAVAVWTSSDTTVATVAADGQVTAGAAAGQATLRATVGSVHGEASVTVTEAVPARIELAPAHAQLGIGQSRQLTARAFTASDREVPTAFTFTSANPAVVSVTGSGLVQGISAGGPVTVTATSGSLSATSQVSVVAAGCSAFAVGTTVNLALQDLQVLQVVEVGGIVPWTGGKEALIRAFVTQDPAGPGVLMPAYVRIRALDGGTVRYTTDMDMPSCIPTVPKPDDPARSINTRLAGNLISQNMVVHAELFGADGVSAGSTQFQASSLGFIAPRPLKIEFIPVRIGDQGTPPSVNARTALGFAQEVFPLATVDATVGAPFTYKGPTGAHNSGDLLVALTEARLVVPASAYIHGMVPAGHFDNVAGIGYVGAPAAWSVQAWDYPVTVAHELGHNFSLWHAPCGPVDPSQVDAGFPHPEGRIGTYGYRASTSQVYLPSNFDLMSYCSPGWISDYNYRKVADFRARAGALSVASSGTPPGPVLVVSGLVSAQGEVTLRPLLQADATAQPPAPGAWRLVFLNHSGTLIRTTSFDPTPLSHGEQAGFAFSLPVTGAEMAQVASVQVIDATGDVAASWSDERVHTQAAAALIRATRYEAGTATITWTPGTFETVLVIDPLSPSVLGSDDTGTMTVLTEASELRILASTGLRSTRFMIQVND